VLRFRHAAQLRRRHPMRHDEQQDQLGVEFLGQHARPVDRLLGVVRPVDRAQNLAQHGRPPRARPISAPCPRHGRQSSRRGGLLRKVALMHDAAPRGLRSTATTRQRHRPNHKGQAQWRRF
jgi:hypothetical protein